MDFFQNYFYVSKERGEKNLIMSGKSSRNLSIGPKSSEILSKAEIIHWNAI
jgi:hypothetical protein